jgi:hypothetical protein
MKKRIYISIFIVSSLCFHALYARAQSLDRAHIFRDYIKYKTGDFASCVQLKNRDSMKASAIVKLNGGLNQDDYLVHLTSEPPGFVDNYLSSYRDLGGGRYEFVNVKFGLPAPGPTWESYTYHFDIVDSATKLTVYDSAEWTIPSGYVTEPLDIPACHAFSGVLLNPMVKWGATLSPEEGFYRLRVYKLKPDDCFDYQANPYRTPLFQDTTFTLKNFTMERGKSYAIGIQSIINHPDADWLINRSQYYVRYDAILKCPADYNDDSKVDGLDFIIFRNEWGRDDCDIAECECDMNCDGKVDGLDFIIFRNNWGCIYP